MFQIRNQNEHDLDFLQRILQREAHAHALFIPQGDETADQLLAQISAYVQDQDKGALIYADEPSGQPVGVAIYRCRGGAGPFTETEVFSRIDPKVLPAKGDFLEVVLFWIHPDYRRLGLGRELAKRLEGEAHHRNIHTIYLQTEGKNAGAMAFTRAMRYKEVYRGPLWDEVVRVGLIKRV